MERRYNVPKMTSLVTDGDDITPGFHTNTLTHRTLLPVPSHVMVGGEEGGGVPTRDYGDLTDLGRLEAPSVALSASTACREQNVVGSVREWASVWCGVGSAGKPSTSPGSPSKGRFSCVKRAAS